MSNQIPEGWTLDTLGKYILSSTAGEWGQEANGGADDIPVLRATNFSQSGAIDYQKLAYRAIDEKKRVKKLLKLGDLVIEKSGGSPTQPVGRVIYFDNESPFLYSNFTQKLSPSKKVDSKFLFYKFYFEYERGSVLKFQQQTTGIINLQLPEYLLFKTVYPPLPEQQKIAKILTSVDEVIEKTQAQIDKLKDLKTGMMQELLTKGVGVDGKPHSEFKDSPVEQIPKGWKITTIAQSCYVRNNLRKPINKTERESIKGIYPYYGPTKAVDFIDEFRVDGKYTLIGEDGDHFTKFSSWSMTQYVTGKFNVNNHAHIIEGSDLCRTKWIYYYFMHRDITASLTRQGATRYKLNKATLEALEFALPTISEQDYIICALDALMGRITASENRVSKLKALKKALMQDLLTGKVRVAID